MYSVHQHWDPLKVCIVGRSYSPEFYSFIKNDRVRIVMERIARETEEDYQKLITLLESFGVEILRPTVTDNYLDYVNPVTGKIKPAPMNPRDHSIMLGSDFYWQVNLHESHAKYEDSSYREILEHIRNQGNNVIKKAHRYLDSFNSASTIRVGKDLYVGHSTSLTKNIEIYIKKQLSKIFVDYRINPVNTGGHADAVMCPVVPGLIVSLSYASDYKETFPGWEVVDVSGDSWDKVAPFLKLKEKNNGKWWVPGEELNDEFTEFVEEWLNHWVGYVEETVFDVNMLVINEKNVVCNNYNKKVFDAFERFGITPHLLNFRHRYFWDGGLHCITSDLDREGTQKDYFPERE